MECERGSRMQPASCAFERPIGFGRKLLLCDFFLAFGAFGVKQGRTTGLVGASWIPLFAVLCVCDSWGVFRGSFCLVACLVVVFVFLGVCLVRV